MLRTSKILTAMARESFIPTGPPPNVSAMGASIQNLMIPVGLTHAGRPVFTAPTIQPQGSLCLYTWVTSPESPFPMVITATESSVLIQGALKYVGGQDLLSTLFSSACAIITAHGYTPR